MGEPKRFFRGKGVTKKMIKKLLLSLLIIVGVGASAFAATKALLSDQATLGASTFSTGTVDLLISNGQTGTFAESQPGYTGSLLPGQKVTKYLRLKNDSTDADFAIAAQATNVTGSLNTDDVIVTFTPVNTSEVAVGDHVAKTLTQWVATPTSLGLPNIPDGNTQEYQMDIMLNENVTTGGASIVFSFVFTGEQVVITPTPSVSVTPTVTPTVTSTETPTPTATETPTPTL